MFCSQISLAVKTRQDGTFCRLAYWGQVLGRTSELLDKGQGQEQKAQGVQNIQSLSS